ncbi:MAG: HupE/UreJ family protein, partial [Arenibacter algicola]|nr:HupE/UreJ family protein [Arenibacter algicola]
MTVKRLTAFSVGFSILGVSTAQAHVGDGVHGVSGALAGIAHPFTGADHMALLLVAGLVAAYVGHTGMVRMATVVLSAWVAGLALAASGYAAPFMEQGIAGGLVVLGAALALGGAAMGRHNATLAMIGASELLHGQAH